MTRLKIKVKNRRLVHRDGSRKLFGEAHDDGTILINPSQRQSERLDTVIHESLHVCYPGWTEGRVRRVATKLAKVLWKDGWRKRIL